MRHGAVKLLIGMPVIDGTKVMLFECGQPPPNGNADVGAFATDIAQNSDVYYEAFDTTIKWFSGPFYVGRTAPTEDELIFQLRKWRNERKLKLSIAGIAGITILYLLFQGY